MPDTLTVNVTQDDIDKGMRGNPFKCPIALAASRTSGYKCAGVDCNDIAVGSYRLDWDARYTVPPVAQYFMSAFDNDEPVEPFSFVAEKI